MLLTVAEEHSSSTVYERSPVSKLECSARSRISRSEGTLRPKGQLFDMFQRSISDVECDSSSDENESYRSYGDNGWRVRVHPASAQKILAIQVKISVLLDEIAFRLSRIPLPDGDRDLRRRQQRVMEFAVRFSRNYLYDLGRQIGEVHRHLRAISPSARSKPSKRGVSLHVQAIEQKLTSAHQLLLNALDAYCKHIPSSVIKGQPGKLKEILRIVVELDDICSKINLTKDYYGCGDVETPPLVNHLITGKPTHLIPTSPRWFILPCMYWREWTRGIGVAQYSPNCARARTMNRTSLVIPANLRQLEGNVPRRRVAARKTLRVWWTVSVCIPLIRDWPEHSEIKKTVGFLRYSFFYIPRKPRLSSRFWLKIIRSIFEYSTDFWGKLQTF